MFWYSWIVVALHMQTKIILFHWIYWDCHFIIHKPMLNQTRKTNVSTTNIIIPLAQGLLEHSSCYKPKITTLTLFVTRCIKTPHPLVYWHVIPRFPDFINFPCNTYSLKPSCWLFLSSSFWLQPFLFQAATVVRSVLTMRNKPHASLKLCDESMERWLRRSKVHIWYKFGQNSTLLCSRKLCLKHIWRDCFWM